MAKLIFTRDVINYLVPKYAKGGSLDIGAGTAKYKNIILNYVSKYETCDVKDGPEIDYIENATKLSFNNDKFDTIFSFQVLEHVDSPDKMISEIFRCLKRGGGVILTVPFLIPWHGDPLDGQKYTVDGLKLLFQKNKFKVLECNGYGGFFTVLGEFLKFLFINPYVKTKHGKIKVKFVNAVMRLFYFLDRVGVCKNDIFYANVYIVAEK